jgi:hypothetical protein
VWLDVGLFAHVLTLMTNEVWFFVRVTMDYQNPYSRFRESIWPLSVSWLELTKYFKFLPQLYRKHAAELLVVRKHYFIGYNKLSDGSMSLGVHSLQEVTPCYLQCASAIFVMAFVLQKCTFRQCKTSRFYLITLLLLGSTRSLTLLNVPGNLILS